MGHYSGERFAVAIHRDPGRRHDGQTDGIHTLCGTAKIGNGAGDAVEQIGRIDLNFGAVEMRGIGGSCYGPNDSPVADDAGFDGRRTAVEAENGHGIWEKKFEFTRAKGSRLELIAR